MVLNILISLGLKAKSTFYSIKRMRVYDPPGLDTNPSQVNYKEMIVFYLMISLGLKAESALDKNSKLGNQGSNSGPWA